MIQDSTFVEEVRALRKTAFGVAYLILKNGSDAEDAMSAAILSAYEHRGNLKQRDSFRAWFLRILRNEAYGILRERRKVVQTDTLPEEPIPAPDTARILDLRAAVMLLREDQRNDLYLQQEGYTMDEIAAILEIPVGTVKSRLARAKDTLRTILEDN